MKAVSNAVAALGLLIASPASVQAQSCLDRETLAAARLHEFEAMMMAVTLRCRAIGVDIGSDYEAMLITHRAVFAAADRKLRAYFAADARGFDRLTTQVGNRYGAGATDPASCGRFDAVARSLAAQPAVSALGSVVVALVAEPRLGSVACPRP